MHRQRQHTPRRFKVLLRIVAVNITILHDCRAVVVCKFAVNCLDVAYAETHAHTQMRGVQSQRIRIPTTHERIRDFTRDEQPHTCTRAILQRAPPAPLTFLGFGAYILAGDLVSF